MAEFSQHNQFGSSQPSRSPDPAQCVQCEAMLADIFDKTLSREQQAIFDRHLAVCPDCSRMFIDAQRGAFWLEMLHDARPEPPADLLTRILATTGPADSPVVSIAEANTLLSEPATAPVYAPAAYVPGKVLPFRQRIAAAFRMDNLRHTFMQPRLAMTAAMAFFSLALTLNLTGIRLSQLKASDFTPSSIKRSFYDANARVVRSIDNLRVVYELESRVHDLQRDSDSSSTPAPESAPQNTPSGDQQPDDQKAPEQKNQQKQSSPRPRSGSSRSVEPARSLQFTASIPRSGHSPMPGSEPRKDFALFTPSFFTRTNQGGQA